MPSVKMQYNASSDSDQVVDGLLMAVMNDVQVFSDAGLPPTEIKKGLEQLTWSDSLRQNHLLFFPQRKR